LDEILQNRISTRCSFPLDLGVRDTSAVIERLSSGALHAADCCFSLSINKNMSRTRVQDNGISTQIPAFRIFLCVGIVSIYLIQISS
jgi:hypothetical protein